MISDGTLNPNEVEKSPMLQECCRRAKELEAEEMAAAIQRTEEHSLTVERTMTALRMLRPVVRDESDFISVLKELAQQVSLELELLKPGNVEFWGDGVRWEPDENTVLFLDGNYAVYCFGKYMKPMKKNAEGVWRQMKEPRETSV